MLRFPTITNTGLVSLPVVGAVPSPLSRMSAGHVAEIVSRELKTPLPDLLSHEREAIRARNILWWLLRQQGRTYSQIARFAGYDQSSITDGIKAIATLRKVDSALDTTCKGLLDKIGGLPW